MLLILKAKFQPFRIYASFVNSSIIDFKWNYRLFVIFQINPWNVLKQNWQRCQNGIKRRDAMIANAVDDTVQFFRLFKDQIAVQKEAISDDRMPPCVPPYHAVWDEARVCGKVCRRNTLSPCERFLTAVLTAVFLHGNQFL